MASGQQLRLPFRWPRIAIAATLGSYLTCVFSLAGAAHALDPNKHITQYIHTSWRIQDGSLPSGMYEIAQTSDGFLWFLSLPGELYRFDGVRFVPWRFPAGVPFDTQSSIFADHAGGLWLAGDKLVRVKDGLATAQFELQGRMFQSISEDPDGSLWVTTRRQDQPLCHVTERAFKCYGKADGIPISPINAILADGSGGFWLGGQTALVQWHAGISETYRSEEVRSLARGPDGTLWVGTSSEIPGKGLQQLNDGALKPFATPTFEGSRFEIGSLMFDRAGNLWVGTIGKGIFRIHGNVVDHYDHTNGLSGDSVWAFFEDREGIVWAGTTSGIDSFRDPAIATFSPTEGLGKDLAAGILASRDGTIWVANAGSLDRIQKGTVTSIRRSNGLPGEQVAAMLEDQAGNIWVGVDDSLYLFKDGRFRRIPEPNHHPLGMVVGLAEGTDGNIWAACKSKPRTLVRIRDFQVREVIPAPQLPPGGLAPDPHGGIWISTRNGDLVLFRNGVVETKFPLNPKPGGYPFANAMIAGADGSLLASSENGLVGWREGKVRRMTTKNGLPCNEVITFTEDKEKRWWLYTHCGVVELPDSELQRWWTNPEAVVQTRVYDQLDGAQPNLGSFNLAATSPDGRVWFANGLVVQVIDPSRLSQNAVPAVAYVESVVVDRKELAASNNLRLPPHPRDVQINYTSPTFLIPQRVKFRYRLDGYDHDWHDAGTRRQAFYTDLPPGKYSFRVIAANSDGVWNDNAAKLDFSVAPAYYQTNWFRALCVAAFLALLWGLYRLRVQQLVREEKKLREAIQTIPAMAFIVKRDGSRELVNRRWVDYTGVSVEQATGSGWQAAIHSDDLKRVLDRWQASLQSGEPLEYEARFRRADGEYRWHLVRALPLRDKHGKILKWYGTATDIEDRKRAEQLQADLAHINRVTTMGELTASLAHEIKQPIAATVTNAQACLLWAKSDHPDMGEIRDAADSIVTAGKRAAEIIDRLRSLYKKAPPKRELVDVNEVGREMVMLLRGEANRHAVSIRTDLADGLPRTMADRVQLQQVLMNLMLNGIEAMKETGGVLTIKSELEEDERLMISVSDTGVGLPAGKADEIFSAFFTTKPQGSGMGLAISRSIVESHSGRVWASANDGRGASFHFTLPIAVAASEMPATGT